jgi:hypothetical protein
MGPRTHASIIWGIRGIFATRWFSYLQLLPF